MPIQQLTATERATLMPTLFVPAETLKKRLDLASPRPYHSPISPRLVAPARQLQSNLLRVRVSKLFGERPAPKITALSPCLARVSKKLDMQRKKDAVSRTLSKREQQEPPKLAFGLASLARKLANRMLRDKLSQQLSPSLIKRSAALRSETSLDCINQAFQSDRTMSPKALSFAQLDNVPALEPSPILSADAEAGWQVVTRKPRKKKQAKPQHKPHKVGKKVRKKKNPRHRKLERQLQTPKQHEERKRSGVYPPTSKGDNPKLFPQPLFSSFSPEQREEHNRACALRRIRRKEEKTRQEILMRLASRAKQEQLA